MNTDAEENAMNRTVEQTCKNHRQSGLTLVEIMVALAVGAVLLILGALIVGCSFCSFLIRFSPEMETESQREYHAAAARSRSDRYASHARRCTS